MMGPQPGCVAAGWPPISAFLCAVILLLAHPLDPRVPPGLPRTTAALPPGRRVEPSWLGS
jgi:hypothetical protein